VIKRWAVDLITRPYIWGLVAILLLLLINLSKDSTYLEITYSESQGKLVGNLIDILKAAAPILMIAVGMCLVIATEGIDLSVGSAMVIAGAISMEYLHDNPNSETLGAALIAVALAIALGAVLGFVNGFLVSVVGLQPFITTLVMMLAGRGVAKVITDGQNTNAESEPFRWIANGHIFGFPAVFIIAAGIVIAVGLLVRRSALGLMIETIGINPKAGRLAGINTRALLMTVYIMSGSLGAVAGIFKVGSVMTVDVSQTGKYLELDAILAVVIGGTTLAGGKFSIRGAAVGALLIATLDKTIIFLGVNPAATDAFKAVVIVAIVLLQSERVRNALRQRDFLARFRSRRLGAAQ
jgi:simple sugar transport system permease protein